MDIGNDFLLVTDTLEHSSKMIKIPLRENDPPVPSMFQTEGFKPWRDFGAEAVWNDPANPHNPMIDATGRVWLTTRVRHPNNPDWCREGSDNAYARYFPVDRAGRHTGYYDPETDDFVLIGTCYGTHHLQFAEDANDTLYFSGGGAVIGWLDTKVYDETGDEQLAQGWCPTVIDTNGDGVITKPWNEPAPRGSREEPPFDPALDTRVLVGAYGIIANPLDDAVWIVSDDFPGRMLRLERGDNPPETCISELYTVPVEKGYRTRGLDVDRNGVLWTALAGSSHFASFDRGECTVFGGPEARDGRQCDAGWSFYKAPGPNFRDTDIGTDFHYYNWVDQFNTLGLGREHPDRQRVELGLAARARSRDRRVDHPARPVPAGLPQPRSRRPHRRSRRRLEGPRRLRHLRGRRRVARGRWPGGAGEPGEVPDPAGPAGALKTATTFEDPIARPAQTPDGRVSCTVRQNPSW